MISISKKTVSSLTKYGLIILFIYIIGFMFIKIAAYYKNSFQHNKLTTELQKKKNETRRLKQQIVITKKREKKLKDSYITKEELEVKVKDIFKRMSVLDYNLRYLDAKKMCIDRYILIAQLTSNNEKAERAGEGILSYIGNMKKSEQDNGIYFIDYITKPKKVE